MRLWRLEAPQRAKPNARFVPLDAELRSGLEGQHREECTAEPSDRLSPRSTDRIADWPADTAQQIAKPTLRCELRCGLERQHRPKRTADRTERLTPRPTECITDRLADTAQQIAKPTLRCELRCG